MRRSRILQPGARYHVTARVNNREMLFEEDESKQLFEQVLYRAKKRFSFSIEHFTIMNNHVHLIIHPHAEESLSRIMQWILSVFALCFNKKSGRSGHFWGERFYSLILNSLQQYIHAYQYITNNPVKAGLTLSASQWRYGGVYHRARKWNFIVSDELPFGFE